MILSRRAILTLAGAGLVVPTASFAASLTPTPRQTEGPFYPYARQLEDDFDLTRLKGHSARAKGPVLDLSGRVFTRDGKPAANVAVELWQANAAGRYAHPGDRNAAAPLDPDFQGYGVQRTDGQGRFRFLTVKPAAYPAGRSMRPAHIHFKLKSADHDLTTQMYFPGDPHLTRDFVFSGQSPTNSPLLGTIKPGADGVTLCAWNVVLG